MIETSKIFSCVRWVMLFSALVLLVVETPVLATTESNYESEIQFYDLDECASAVAANSPAMQTAGLVGDTNAEKVFNFLRSKFNPNAAAGLVGNFMHESGGGTEDIDPEAFNSTGPHIGIAQWSTSRYKGLEELAEKNGLTAKDLLAQAQYVLFELSAKGGYGGTAKKLNRATSPNEASDIVFAEYERPGDSTAPRRALSAQQIFDKYGSGSPIVAPAVASEPGAASASCICTSGSFSPAIAPAGEPTKSREDFIKRYAEVFLGLSKRYGVPYDAVLAQVAVESGNGGSQLTTKYNNFGGIKAQPGKPRTPPLPTIEGAGRHEMHAFRAFATPEEGIEEQFKFYVENSRYKQALKYPQDPERFIEELKKAGYATSPTYVKTVVGVLKEVQKVLLELGLPLSKDVTPDALVTATESESGTVASGCAPDGSAAFTLGDYAFPVAIPKADVTSNNPFPCTASNCHHDGSPAFDLSKKSQDDSSAGVAVFAMESGEIVKYNPEYDPPAPLGGPIPGCPSYQLGGDSGWVYWYGHTQTDSLKLGTKVMKGEQIAVIGERKCTGNGSYPHLHIDRGTPKGSLGGSVSSRDASLVEIMNALWEAMP